MHACMHAVLVQRAYVKHSIHKTAQTVYQLSPYIAIPASIETTCIETKSSLEEDQDKCVRSSCSKRRKSTDEERTFHAEQCYKAILFVATLTISTIAHAQ